jgi:hypothetical protein
LGGLGRRAAGQRRTGDGHGLLPLLFPGVAGRLTLGEFGGQGPFGLGQRGGVALGPSRGLGPLLGLAGGLLGGDPGQCRPDPGWAPAPTGPARRQLVPARRPEHSVLGRIDPLGLFQHVRHYLDQLPVGAGLVGAGLVGAGLVGAGLVESGGLGDQPLVAAVGQPGGVRRDLRPVDGDGAQPGQSRRPAQPQHLGEQLGEHRCVGLAEPGDDRVIRCVPGADHPERHVGGAQLLDPPAGAFPTGVPVDQQGEQHVRVVACPPCRAARRCPVPAGRCPLMQRRGVQRRHRVDYEPGQMPVGQPLGHVRRQQKALIPIHRPVTLRHQQILPLRKIH